MHLWSSICAFVIIKFNLLILSMVPCSRELPNWKTGHDKKVPSNSPISKCSLITFQTFCSSAYSKEFWTGEGWFWLHYWNTIFTVIFLGLSCFGTCQIFFSIPPTCSFHTLFILFIPRHEWFIYPTATASHWYTVFSSSISPQTFSSHVYTCIILRPFSKPLWVSRCTPDGSSPDFRIQSIFSR